MAPATVAGGAFQGEQTGATWSGCRPRAPQPAQVWGGLDRPSQQRSSSEQVPVKRCRRLSPRRAGLARWIGPEGRCSSRTGHRSKVEPFWPVLETVSRADQADGNWRPMAALSQPWGIPAAPATACQGPQSGADRQAPRQSSSKAGGARITGNAAMDRGNQPVRRGG